MTSCAHLVRPAAIVVLHTVRIEHLQQDTSQGTSPQFVTTAPWYARSKYCWESEAGSPVPKFPLLKCDMPVWPAAWQAARDVLHFLHDTKLALTEVQHAAQMSQLQDGSCGQPIAV